MVDRERQRREVGRNYDVFVRQLGALPPTRRDQQALMRDGEIVDFFRTAGDAFRDGLRRFPDEIFSVQEVTDVPIDLGFWSHV